MPYEARDPTNYSQHLAYAIGSEVELIKSRPLNVELPDGKYVYVQDVAGTILVLPDGHHHHPLVLGGAQAAMYAGELEIRQGQIVVLNNLSGTFRPDGKSGLKQVARAVAASGFEIAIGAIWFMEYSRSGSSGVLSNWRSNNANPNA